MSNYLSVSFSPSTLPHFTLCRRHIPLELHFTVERCLNHMRRLFHFALCFRTCASWTCLETETETIVLALTGTFKFSRPPNIYLLFALQSTHSDSITVSLASHRQRLQHPTDFFNHSELKSTAKLQLINEKQLARPRALHRHDQRTDGRHQAQSIRHGCR